MWVKQELLSGVGKLAICAISAGALVSDKLSLKGRLSMLGIGIRSGCVRPSGAQFGSEGFQVFGRNIVGFGLLLELGEDLEGGVAPA